MSSALDFILRILLFVAGSMLVLLSLLSAVRTFVLPRSAPDPLVRFVFLAVRWLFNARLRFVRTFFERDWIMAFYAPLSLMGMLPVWYFLVMVGYGLIFRALGAQSWFLAFRLSISSVTTLGYEPAEGIIFTCLSFTEAVIGLMLVALLLAYLPAMYSAFARREAQVARLEVRTGDPPSAVAMIKHYHQIQGLEYMASSWPEWEQWFTEIEESHTSLSALVFFRSPQPNHSWVTAGGAVLDAAALTLSAVDLPYDPRAALCIRAGYLALRRIANYFHIQEMVVRFENTSISIQREDFDNALAELQSAGVPLKPDRDQAWEDFAGWRVNYDRVLLDLVQLTMAPWAPWSSDRVEKV